MHATSPTTESPTETPSVLRALRALLPARPLHLSEALRLAELQANRLLELTVGYQAPVPAEIVTDLPRITVEYEIDMPCSGASAWDLRRRSWIITLNALEPDTRQRFSLLHEYKHIIDHGSAGLHANGHASVLGRDPVEYVCDYFAACALMPKRLVKQAWGDGIQRVSDLADLFDVSPAAMDIRLAHVGLTTPRPRCAPTPSAMARPVTTWRARRYQRALSEHGTRTTAELEVVA